MTFYDSAVHMMESIGGSFVRSLAHCYHAADGKNRSKLREAFAEYFDSYERQYRAWKDSQALERRFP